MVYYCLLSSIYEPSLDLKRQEIYLKALRRLAILDCCIQIAQVMHVGNVQEEEFQDIQTVCGKLSDRQTKLMMIIYCSQISVGAWPRQAFACARSAPLLNT